MPDDRPSLLRPRNIVLGLLAAALLALGLLAFRIARLTPGKPGRFNAQLQQLIEDGQPASAPDAWPVFTDALARFASVTDPLTRSPRPGDWPEGLAWPPSPEELDPASPPAAAALRELLARHDRAGVFAALDRLAESERIVRPIPPGRLLDMLLPELTNVRGLARLSPARFRLAVADGDQPAAVRAAAHILALSHTCQRQSTLIEHLIAVACQGFAVEEIQAAAAAGRLSPQTCRELLALLHAHAPKIDTARAFKGEHYFAQDIVEWTHSDDGRGDGLLIPSRMLPMLSAAGAPAPSVPPLIADFASLAAPSKKTTLRAFERFYTLSQQYAAAPLRVRPLLESPDDFVQTLPRNMMLVRLLTPAMGQYIRVADTADLDVAATKIMLALELHKAAHGGYPAALDALDPPLASLRIDPQWPPELRYRPPAPAPGTDGVRDGYVLYWVGIDGVDNQGLHPPKSGRRSLLSATVGLDFVFTPQPVAPPSPPPNLPQSPPPNPLPSPPRGP